MVREIIKGITIDPKVRFGKPVIVGTRVPVDIIVAKIANGMTIDVIMREYDLTRQQVQHALGYAAALVAKEEFAFA
jgi:uncharacterized protein (DUF433 family)